MGAVLGYDSGSHITGVTSTGVNATYICPVYDVPTLNFALDHAESGGTIELSSNVTTSGTLDIDKNVTIDLNGNTLTFRANSEIGKDVKTVNGGFAITEVTALTVHEDAAVTVSSGAVATVASGGKITYYGKINDAIAAAEAIESGATIKLIGDHSNTTEIKLSAGKNLTIDASEANFGGVTNLKITIGGSASGLSTFVEGSTIKNRTGEYTLTGFQVAGSLSVGTMSTILKISDCEVEALDLFASNTFITVDDNKIIGEEPSYRRYDGGDNSYGLYVYADHFDLTLTKNIIRALNTTIGILGDYEGVQVPAGGQGISLANNITIAANELYTTNGKILKIWNTATYAPVEYPADFTSTTAMNALAEELFSENIMSDLKVALDIHARANGKGDKMLDEENHDAFIAIEAKYVTKHHRAGSVVKENIVEPTYDSAGSHDDVVYCTGCGDEISRTAITDPKLVQGPSLYTIKVASTENGKATARSIAASKGSTITINATPNTGYEVDTIVVTDASGNELEIIESNGKPAFVMPASKVTVTVTFRYDLPYSDVADDNVHYDAIAYMYQNGLMIGTSTKEYIFSGDLTMTRGQIAQILYRLAGEPAADYAGTFTDISKGEWYTAAVEWAHSKGIIVGTGNGKFEPHREITVGEMTAMVYRYAQYQLTGSYESTASDWTAEFAEARTWCVENGILPEGTTVANRYLAADMFYNVYNLLNQ